MWVTIAHQEKEVKFGCWPVCLVSLMSVPVIHIHVHKLTRSPCRSLLLLGAENKLWCWLMSLCYPDLYTCNTHKLTRGQNWFYIPSHEQEESSGVCLCAIVTSISPVIHMYKLTRGPKRSKSLIRRRKFWCWPVHPHNCNRMKRLTRGPYGYLLCGSRNDVLVLAYPSSAQPYFYLEESHDFYHVEDL